MTYKEEGTLHTLKVFTIIAIVAAASYYAIFTIFKSDITYVVNSVMSYFGG